MSSNSNITHTTSHKYTCLIILPTNHNQLSTTSLKIEDLIIIINQLEQNDFDIKFATYQGHKPFLNFENSSLYKEWLDKHDELISTVLNIKNINTNLYDCLILPSYPHLYAEMKIDDYDIINVVKAFHKDNKMILAYEHSVYVLCKCFEDKNESKWCFNGFNMTGLSIRNSIYNDIYTYGEIPEELITLQGGKYIEAKGKGDLIISDKNIITLYDNSSLKLGMILLINKVKL